VYIGTQTSEAEIFADNGFDDIYIANEVVDAKKIRRVAQLAARIKRLRINVDDSENLKQLWQAALYANATIEVMVEVNIGHNRTGLSVDEAVQLGQEIADLQQRGGVVFGGVAGYEGHTPVLPRDDKRRETQRGHAMLAATRSALEQRGITVRTVSAGGSSNYVDALDANVITELQAGGGALTDALYYHHAGLSHHDHRIAAFIVTQVMAVDRNGQHAMADAGFKTVGWHPFAGLPLVLDRPDIAVSGLSAEHLKLKPTDPSKPINVKRGDKVWL
jgi:3-hydroxy-D-aspartate aldolase